MNNDIAISVKNLSKCYEIYSSPSSRLKQFIVPRLKHLFGKKATNYYREFWALKDISIEATWCYPVQCWPRIIRMVESGNFPIEKIITANISSDHVVKQGFDALLDKSVNHMKILVTV